MNFVYNRIMIQRLNVEPSQSKVSSGVRKTTACLCVSSWRHELSD